MNKKTKIQRQLRECKEQDLVVYDPLGMSKYSFFINQLKMLLTKTSYVTLIMIRHD